MSYERQGYYEGHKVPRVGDHYTVNGAKALSRWNINADEEMYNNVAGTQPYIPPIVDDDAIPDDYNDDELQDVGDIPRKRIKAGWDALNLNNHHLRIADYDVGATHRVFDIPFPVWDSFTYITNLGLNNFFTNFVGRPDLFPKVYGPFDGFEERMCTVELNVNQRTYHFAGAEALIPFIAHALGVAAIWAMKHIEAEHPARLANHCFYKAMINAHCVFIKEYADGNTDLANPKREYRRFIFDKMCENEKGQYYKVRLHDSLYKIVFNSFVDLAFDKLEGTDTAEIPYLDSKFEFYSIRTACVTVFQYEPLRIGSYIKTPPNLSKKKSIMNPKVEEDCFKYSVLFGIVANTLSQEDIRKYSTYCDQKILDILFKNYNVSANFDSLPEPYFTYKEELMDKFCEDNPDLFLTVWVSSEDSEDRIPVHPIYQCERRSLDQKIVNLLLISELDDEGFMDDLEEGQKPLVNHHFACITNVDGLFYECSGRHRVHVCPICNVRRRIDTKGLGFCKLHEPVQYKLAIDKAYDKNNQIKDAIAIAQPVYHNMLDRLCPKCSYVFDTKADLIWHSEECLVRDNNYRIINLPKERQYLQLSGKDRIKLTMLHTFMVADFESILDPIGSLSGNQYYDSEHIPCSYALVMESDYPELQKFKVKFGKTADDTIQDFCDTILRYSQEAYEFYQTYLPMVELTESEQASFEQSDMCYICGRPFSPVKGCHKVRDHDHLTGLYLGAACEGCNINRRPDRMNIPLFFHNGKNYDTHLLIKEITKERYDCKFEGIAQNSQKIMSFTISKFHNELQEDGTYTTTRSMCDIKVLDSILFLLSSLSKLVEVQKHKSKWDGNPDTEVAMRGYEDVFPITYKWLKVAFFKGRLLTYPEDMIAQYDPRITLAMQKNAYPYKWFDKFEKFLLPISELTYLFDKHLYEFFTDTVTSSYMDEFAKKRDVYKQVVKAFDFKTVEQYAKLYVAMDVLQLADILQETRMVYRGTHKLDMFQFYGLPGYTWAAFQLHIDQSPYKPQLFMEGEMDMVCFIARAIRGGCSGTMLRYSHVNNKFMEDKFDPEERKKYLVYLDANNLYGWSMSQDLPYGEFEWYPQDQIDEFNASVNGYELFYDQFLSQLGDGQGAYIMCDLEFPQSIHDKYNWYPLAPESGYVPEEWLSAYQQIMHEVAGTKHDPKSRLLLQTLNKREKYVTYYKNLKFYLDHGMAITRIYKILTFREAPLMKSYIQLNTDMRNKATSVAEKNQWKNANNSAYGKTFENQLNYSILRFVSGDTEYNKAVRDPGFDGYAYMSDNLMLAKMKYTSVNFDKPIYLGATITELAKLHMFEFYYDVLMDHFGEESIKLCMTDTDSVLVEVECEDIYEEIAKIQQKYDSPIDTSPLDEKIIEQYGIIGNHNKEVGYFKPESDPISIQEFVGLRPKVYSTRERGSLDPHMRCKGTPKQSMDLYVRHDNYLACLFHDYKEENIRQHVEVDMIRSKDHHIYSIQTEKVSLSCNDSKRFILRDNIHTLAYGHYAISQYRALYEEGNPPKDGAQYCADIISYIPEKPILKKYK